LFDGKTLDNFAKKDKTFVKGGELVVGAELVTTGTWPAAEFEIEFAVDQTAKLQVGVKNEWVLKTDVGRGKHTLWLRATRNGVEAQLDGRSLKPTGGSGDADGPLRLKVDAGPLKVLHVRHRPPGQ
jgi:hypothetical protein